ncbi:MAG TPA: PAS domain S-box protein [Anaerolineales bacterium]|nr:PAS domain S-box protein [Anaerolineales bacterium]
MSMKTQRKAKAESASYKAIKKGRRSLPKTASRSNGNHPLAYEHLHIGIVQSSLNGEYMDVNEEFCRILGYSKEEVLQLSVKECTHEDDYDIDIRLHEQLVSGQIPFYVLEKRYVRKDGRVVWVELTRSLACDADGKPVCTMGVVIDISEHKQVERALRESSENLRLATEAARMFKWELDFQKQLYTFADNFAQVLGFSAGLLPQNSREAVWKLSPEEDVQVVSEAIAKAIKDHRDVHSLQYRMVNPEDGQTVWLEVNAKVVYDHQGNAQRMFGVAQNITENKRVEELERTSTANVLAVAEANAKFRVFFDQGSNFAGLMTLDGTLVEANHLCLDFCGFRREDVIGKKFWDCGWWNPSPDLVEMVRRGTQEAAAGKLFRQETIYFLADGSERYVDLIITPVRDETTGRLLFLAPTGTDITERKQAEEALRAKESELQEIINRTPFMLTRCTRDLRYRFVSDAYARMIGRTPEEVAGKPILEIMGAEGLRTISPYIEKVLQGQQVEYETEVSFQSAGTPSLHVVYTPDRDEQGSVIGWFASIIDVTERKRTEQALAEFARQQEALYRLSDQLHHTNSLTDVYNAALNAILSALQCDRASILLFDDTGVMRYVAWRGVSDRYRKATEGHSPWGPGERDPYPICVSDPGASDLSDSLKANIREEGIASLAFIPLISNGKLIGKFMVYFNKSHDCSDVEIELSLMIARQLASGIDHKRAEEQLRESEERLRVTFDTAVVGFATLTPDARFEEVNDAFCSIVGYTREELLQMNCAELTHPFYIESTYDHINQLVAGEIPSFVIEKLYVRKDGAEIWVQNNVSIVRRTDGVPLHLIAICQDITERKQSEEKLRASEALYRTIARSIPGGGVYVVDKDFRYMVAEGPVTEAFGLSRDSLEGQTVWEAFPGERGERMRDRLKRTYEGEILNFETEYNGHVYWTQQAPLHDSIGQAIIVTIDITERKQAEEALRQSEERFARFMQHLPGLAWIKDMQGRYVYANAAAEKAFSVPREKLYGKTDLEIFPPKVAAQYKRNDEQALINEKGMQTIEMLQQDDGILHYSLVNKFPIPGPDGNPALIGGTAFDITERLQAEAALHESEERLRAILSQATAGIVRKDAEGRLIFVNQAYCSMLGYTESELLGKTFWQFTYHEDIAENKKLYDRLMVEGTPFKLEKRIVRKDGSLIWVDVSVSPVMDADGKPQSAVAVEVDITGRKQAEEALQQLNLQLESRVQKRTATIQAMNQSLREEIAERRRVEEALRASEALARASEEKLRTLFDLLPVGISFLDPEGNVIEMNSALLNILKLSREQILSQAYKSRKYTRVDGTPMLPTEFAGARALAENRTIYNVETGITLEDGEVVWTSVSAAPVDVADVGVVVVTVDITESRRAERALQESHGRLRVLSQRLVEVQEEERRALARELHDRVGQTLAALNINLIIINGQLSAEAAQQIGARLDDSMKLVAETISLVRDVMTDLRPAVLDDYGLEAALEGQLNGFKSRYTIEVVFEKPDRPIPRLGPSIEMTFLRIAQEALMNIAKHAHAGRVNLFLRQEEGLICLTIQDDGIGIESWQNANRPGSHGLTIMRERAEAFGGTLKVRSMPGQGTTVEASIPFNKNEGQKRSQEEQRL